MPEPKSVWKLLPFNFDGDPGPAPPPSTLPEELARFSTPERERIQRHIDERCEYFTRVLYGQRVSGEALRTIALIISNEVGASVTVQVAPTWEEGGRLIGYEVQEPLVRRPRDPDPEEPIPVEIDGQVIGHHIPNADGTNPWADIVEGVRNTSGNLRLYRRAEVAFQEAQHRLPGGSPEELLTLAVRIAEQTCAGCQGTGEFAMPQRIAREGTQTCFRCNGVGIDISIGRSTRTV